MTRKITLALSRPIKAHGADVTSLEFREPTGDDLIEAGIPFATDDNRKTFILPGETYANISRLAGIPLSSAKSLAPMDFIKAFGIVASFFGAGAETNPVNSSGDTTS